MFQSEPSVSSSLLSCCIDDTLSVSFVLVETVPQASVILKGSFNPGVVVHTYNPSTQETEAGVSQVQGQPGQS
jgi:hypothetical protein